MANALVYYAAELIEAVKSFIVQLPWPYVIKLSLSVNYKFLKS